MNIVASSSLLNSLYSECVPLVVFAKQDMRSRATSCGTSHGKGEGHHSSNCNDCDYDNDVAFLSSVRAPSELCLSLACIAQRREAVRRSEVGPLLVFVPFDTPREEVFVEMPISAFAATDERRKLRLVPLNEYSVLCSRVKDGLPPRKGVFVSFRSAEAQQRFCDALERVISDCSRHNRPPENKPLLWRKLGFLPSAIETKRERKNMQREEEVHETHAVVGRKVTFSHPSHAQQASDGARCYIDGLLAERDKRREDCIANKYGPLQVDNNSGGGGGNVDFVEWAQQHQDLRPKTWNVINGALARQAETRRRGDDCTETSTMPPRSYSTRDTKLSLQDPSSLVGREALFHELRAAMEVYDDMTAAQKCNEINLIGAARQFLQQHQADLWRRQQAATEQQQYQHPVVGGVDKRAQDAGRVEVSPKPPLLSGASENQQEDKREREKMVQNAHQTRTVTAPAAQQVMEAESVVKTPNFEDRLEKELRRAREVESRILSSFQQTPARTLIQMSFSNDTANAPLVTAEKEKENSEEEEKAGVFTKTLQNTDTATSTHMLEDVKVDELTDTPAEDVSGDAGGKCQQCGCGWKEVRDPVSGRNYYVHTATKKTTWRIADTFNKYEPMEKNVTERTPQACGSQWRVVTDPKIEETFADDNSAPQMSATAALQQPQIKDNDSKTFEWAERKDPSTGKMYYYNKKSKKTTWDRSETDLGLT